MKNTLTHFLLRSLFLSNFALLLIPMAAIAEDTEARARYDDKATGEVNDSGSTVARASEVYRNLLKEGKVPPTLLKEARCIAVFPSVRTAALAVGGTHGDGVAFCRQAGGEGGWSSPVFLDLNAGSIGLQAGAKSSDLVLYLKAPGSREAIENGEFALSGELSVVAGDFEETFRAPSAGVVAYSTTSGVFAGASIIGGKISLDKDEQRSFYGTYDKNSMFEGKIPSKVKDSVENLKKQLPA